MEPKKHCRPKKTFPSAGFSLLPVLLFITPATAAPLTEQAIPAWNRHHSDCCSASVLEKRCRM
jgi:hypothetical protein